MLPFSAFAGTAFACRVLVFILGRGRLLCEPCHSTFVLLSSLFHKGREHCAHLA